MRPTTRSTLMPTTQNPFTVKNGLKLGIGFFIAKWLYVNFRAIEIEGTKALDKLLTKHNLK